MPSRVELQDRHDVFADDLNAISLLIYNDVIRRHFGFLAAKESYVIKGLDLAPGGATNSFNLEPGLGIDANGEMVEITETILNIALADLTVGAINVVTLSYRDVPDTDPSDDAGPLGERNDISPRPQRGRDVDDPDNEIFPTRVYAGFNIHVEPLALYNALSSQEQALRIRLRKLVTPVDGVVDPDAIDDPEFPGGVEFNFPDDSIPPGAIIGFDDAITNHQREAHVNFIFGDSSEVSFTTQIDTVNTNVVDVNDVDLDRAYYVNGIRRVRGDLLSFTVSFSTVLDPSGTYVIAVQQATDNTLPPVLVKGVGIQNEAGNMPVAVYQWDAVTGVLTFITDVRNFLSVRFDNDTFSSFLGPLLALFGTGYFQGALLELTPTSTPAPSHAAFIRPGYGLVRSQALRLSKVISNPTGIVIPMDPPDSFGASQVATLVDSGDAINSVPILLTTNGSPPHQIGNVSVTAVPAVSLTEGTHYTVDRVASTITFKFIGVLSIGSEVEITYTYGLPRFDLIALNYNDGFSIVRGVSAQSPVKPTLPSGSVEWGVVTVPELGAQYGPGDFAPGLGYKSLTLGFNYDDASRSLKNRLGRPELVLDLNSPDGVTGATLPSTPSLTINQRFEVLESLVGGTDIQSRPILGYRWRVMLDQTLNIASFDPVLVSKVRDASKQAKDLGALVRLRLSLVYRDNIPATKPLKLHVLVKNSATNALLHSFSVSSMNAQDLHPTHGISTHATTWFDHDEAAAPDLTFEVQINNAKRTKTNAANGGELLSIEAELLDLHLEAWIFPAIGGI